MFKKLFLTGEDALDIPIERVFCFIIGIKKNMYRKNPYHNYAMTFDLVQGKNLCPLELISS